MVIQPKDMICCEGRIATVKRKAVHDAESLRCYRCHLSYDRAIALQEYDGACPDCGQAMRPAVSHYVKVCSRCNAELFGKLHH